MAPIYEFSEEQSRAIETLGLGKRRLDLELKSQVAKLDTSKHIVVPQDYSGLSYSFGVSPGRLAEGPEVREAAKKTGCNWENTGVDSLGRKFIGNNDWKGFTKLVNGLGAFIPDMQEAFYLFKLLKDGAKNKVTVYDVSGKRVDPNTLQGLHNDFFNIQSPWRANYFGTKFKKEGENIVAYSRYTLENGVLVPQKKLILSEDTLMEDRLISLENFTSQGFPSTKTNSGKITYWFPRDTFVAGLCAGPSRAGLYCDGRPSFRGSYFGVLTATEVKSK